MFNIIKTIHFLQRQTFSVDTFYKKSHRKFLSMRRQPSNTLDNKIKPLISHTKHKYMYSFFKKRLKNRPSKGVLIIRL